MSWGINLSNPIALIDWDENLNLLRETLEIFCHVLDEWEVRGVQGRTTSGRIVTMGNNNAVDIINNNMEKSSLRQILLRCRLCVFILCGSNIACAPCGLPPKLWTKIIHRGRTYLIPRRHNPHCHQNWKIILLCMFCRNFYHVYFVW